MELFQLCDERGNPLGSAPRALCHGNPLLIHMVVHLHVFDAAGRLYLQKRALSKDTNPGRWDTSVGGHVMAGESVEAALAREASEELGIGVEGARRLYGFLYHSGRFETEYAFSFSVVHSGEIRPDPGEIADGRFFSLGEIQSLLGTRVLTPMFELELPMLRKAREAPA